MYTPFASLFQMFLLSKGNLFQASAASLPLRCFTLLKYLLPVTCLLVLSLPSFFLRVLVSPFFFFQSSLITEAICWVVHLLCSFVSLWQWCLKKDTQSFLDALAMVLDLTCTCKEEDSPSLLSSFCSEPRLNSEPSLDEGLTLEWNLVAEKEDLMCLLADFSAAILASLLARSALTSASEEEMSSLERQFFLRQMVWRFCLARMSSESHSLMILLTIQLSLSLGNWALYLLYFCLENSLQTLPMASFLVSFTIEQRIITLTDKSLDQSHDLKLHSNPPFTTKPLLSPYSPHFTNLSLITIQYTY